MTKNTSLYFVAIVPEGEVALKAITLKRYFAQHHRSKAALRSPPHITLHMPFRLQEKKEDAIIEDLNSLSENITTFEVQIDGFGCFKPRVIYLDILSSNHLDGLFENVQNMAKRQWNLFNSTYKDRPFKPHMTVAFRDLSKSSFQNAWEKLRDVDCQLAFECTRLSLLKHDSKKWNVLYNAPLRK